MVYLLLVFKYFIDHVLFPSLFSQNRVICFKIIMRKRKMRFQYYYYYYYAFHQKSEYYRISRVILPMFQSLSRNRRWKEQFRPGIKNSFFKMLSSPRVTITKLRHVFLQIRTCVHTVLHVINSFLIEANLICDTRARFVTYVTAVLKSFALNTGAHRWRSKAKATRGADFLCRRRQSTTRLMFHLSVTVYLSVCFRDCLRRELDALTSSGVRYTVSTTTATT